MSEATNYDHLETTAYWLGEAQEIINILDFKRDDISFELEIAAYLRKMYSLGKKAGVYEWNNKERG